MLMNARSWMGIRQLLCSHPSVFNKDVPFPLCCSPSTWTTLITLQTGWEAHSLVLQIFWWPTCCLQMTFPSCPKTLPTCRPLNKLRAWAQRKYLTVNTQMSEVMCFNSYTNNLPPLFYDGAQLPYTNSLPNIWACFVTDMSIWIPQLMQRYAHSQLVLSTSNSLYRSMTLPTGYTSTCGSWKHAQFLPACKQAKFGPSHSYDRAKKWLSYTRNGCWRCSKG